jgi:translocation and assembly module TamB
MAYFINYTTKHMDLTYDQVSGNLLKTITLKNVRYKDKILCTEASINWNLRALLTATLKIDEISILDLDIPLTEQWIEHLREKFGSSDKSPENIPTIEVSQVVFSAKPFENKTIKVSRIELQANDIKGDLRHVDVGFFSFLTESDYADITALGKLVDSELFFEKLWLANIDIEKIATFIHSRIKHESDEDKKKSQERNPSLIKSLLIDDLIVYTKPLKYRHYDIKNWSLSIRQLATEDLKNFNAAHVYIDAITNMWSLSSSGRIQNNHLYTEADVEMNDSYFKRFVPFFDFTSINPIKLYIDVDQNGLNGKLYAKSPALLIKKYQDLQVSVPDLHALVTFNFKTLQMEGSIGADIRSKYTPHAKLDGGIYYDRTKHFRYDGVLSIPHFTALPEPVITLLEDSNITFEGNSTTVQANIKNRLLEGTYGGENYVKPQIHLTTKELTPTLFIAKDTKLPQKLKPLLFKIDTKAILNYKAFLPIKPDISITSNVADVEAAAIIGKTVKLTANLKQTKGSLIRKEWPNIIEKNLFPLDFKLDLDYRAAKGSASLKNRFFHIDAQHNFANTNTHAALLLDKQHSLTIDGNMQKDCNLTLKTASLRELQQTAHKLYRFQKLPMDGDITATAKMHNLSSLSAQIKGKWFIYEYKPNRFLFAEKIAIDAKYENDRLTIANYHFNTYLDRDRYFFAQKPSTIRFDKKRITIDTFFINDYGIINGWYDLASKRGKLQAKAKNYHYKDFEGDLYFDTNLEITLSTQNTDVEGEITINRGTITYEPKKEHNIHDDDIIIIQNQKKRLKEDDKLSLDISIVTKRPIYYKIPGTDVKLTLDLKIWKELHHPLELLGIVRILSGTHTQSGKEFELEPSEILFGGDPLNPYLNIRAIHHSDPYTIYVNINGQMETPSINFNSSPYLNQSDILSILLFNTTTEDLIAGNQDNSKTAISMFGSVFAKEIVQNFGIKLDKLVLTTTEEGKLGVELGKKISKKVTLIYINDIVQTIKIRYKLSDHFETDFIFSPDNSGADIIYKDEY